jgi:hypothetical protein
MKTSAVILACNNIVHSNRGISLVEEIKLQQLPKVKVSENRRLTATELVSLAHKVVVKALGRKNITPRDMKKAIINIIYYD